MAALGIGGMAVLAVVGLFLIAMVFLFAAAFLIAFIAIIVGAIVIVAYPKPPVLYVGGVIVVIGLILAFFAISQTGLGF